MAPADRFPSSARSRGRGFGQRFPGGPPILVAAVLLLFPACDALFTEPPDDADVLDGPLPGLTPEERDAFVAGDEAFERSFSPSEGLGPIFNNSSCGNCHSGDGRGRPENALIRIGVPPDMARDAGGPQIQDRAVSGAVPERVPDGIPLSVRIPPPVFGVGLVEAIPEETILALADPADEDGDGISGRPNWVEPPDWVPEDEPGGGPGRVLGRFSRKAQISTLLQQVVEAYHQDMGLTTDFLPEENENRQSGVRTGAADRAPDPEVPASEVQAVLEYIRMLAPPAPGEMTPDRRRGEELFGEIGCAECHVPELETGPHRIRALSSRPVRLYSDLLLHDMGEELADGRPDGSASGREWRTAPLWGLRVVRDFLAGDAFFLHDGRARTVEEAVLYHGGEAEAARRAFEALSAGAREDLLGFVRSR